MKSILDFLTTHLSLLYLGLSIFTALVLTMLEKFAFTKIRPKVVRRSKIWDESLVLAAHYPLLFIIWSSVLMISYKLVINIYPKINVVDEVLVKKLIIIVFLFWFLLSLINKIEDSILKKITLHTMNTDATTVIALSHVSRIIIISTLSLMLLQSMGISISALLAFGGIGALTVGFAAKDTLANLLGGFMIFIDRPFSVGDFIKSPDNQIEGNVEHIGWRLTRIRDTEMNARYVPNALFSTLTLTNLTRIRGRRIKTTAKLRFQDLKEITPIVNEIKFLLKSHPEINQNETIAVSLQDIGDYSLNLLILAFTKTTDWIKYLEVQQEVLLKILQIIHNHHAEYALPTIDTSYSLAK